MSRYQTANEAAVEKARKESDVEWFASKVKQLTEELVSERSFTRARYLREMLSATLTAHQSALAALDGNTSSSSGNF